MRLTKKKALEITLEKWERMVETGQEELGCPLCDYSEQWKIEAAAICSHCPYFKAFGFCDEEGKPYFDWCEAETTEGQKAAASRAVEQLKQLLGER